MTQEHPKLKFCSRVKSSGRLATHTKQKTSYWYILHIMTYLTVCWHTNSITESAEDYTHISALALPNIKAELRVQSHQPTAHLGIEETCQGHSSKVIQGHVRHFLAGQITTNSTDKSSACFVLHLLLGCKNDNTHSTDKRSACFVLRLLLGCENYNTHSTDNRCACFVFVSFTWMWKW